MQILSVNSEKKLANIAASVRRNPQTWNGWKSLHIKITNAKGKEKNTQALLWVESIVDSYLKGVDGKVYFCFDQDIHIICKNTSEAILVQAASQICNLLLDESNLMTRFKVYDLAESGELYSDEIFTGQEDILKGHFDYTPSQQAKEAHDVKLAGLESDVRAKRALKEGAQVRVLLVEDDAVTRWMVRNCLKDHCQFVTASTANQAYAMFQSFQPDIVFLDINLPDKNGMSVLKWIIEHDPGVCVVMFSSNDNLDNISQTLEHGAAGFIAKPFLQECLLGYVHGQKGKTLC